tara:strand:- start:1226 stop:1390 length:165 start_codon:yes stop_codon:yes gene_type:complete
MSKIDKKKVKLVDRIKMLQDELTQSLTKKDSSVEINVGVQQRKIQELKLQLNNL